MIVFGNLYLNKERLARFNIIGLYQNGQLELLDKEMKRELFPNAGKLFIPQDVPVPNKVKYGLYNVYESTTYEPEKPTSLKYALGTEVRNVKLYEVIPIKVPSHDVNLCEKFQEGFRLPYEPLANVLVHTEDHCIIGPLQLKKRGNDDVWEVHEANFAPCRHNNLKFLRYENVYASEPERVFTVADFLEPEIDYVDIASNERAIREMLKFLRANADFGELSRKTIQQLSKLGDSGYITEEHVNRRLQRVIHLLNVHTLDEAFMEEIQKNLFELPYMRSYIEQELESQKRQYRKQLEEDLRKLLKQVKELKKESDRLNQELDNKRREKERLEETVRQLQTKSEEKIAEIQSNVIDVFVNQLTLRGLAFSEIASALSHTSERISAEPVLYALTIDRRVPVYTKLEDFWTCLEQNIHTHDYQLLAQTIVCAIALDTPILITGMRALELSQLLALCAAANETLTILPEINSFSLVGLAEQFKVYNHSQEVKALILHNAHLTSAECSLPAFLKLKRWFNVSMVPDLVLLSIDQPETAEEFMDKFPLSPVLEADFLMKRMMHRPFIPPEACGQLMLTTLDELSVDGMKGEREAFEEWVLDKHGLEPEPWPKEFDDWLGFLSLVDSRPEERFQWMWRMFNRYWQLSNQKK